MPSSTLVRVALATIALAACDHFGSNARTLEITALPNTNTLNPPSIQVAIRDTFVLHADGAASDWSWTSADSNVVAVRQTGVVIARSPGQVTVTARLRANPSTTRTGTMLVVAPRIGYPGAAVYWFAEVADNVAADPNALHGLLDVHVAFYSPLYFTPRTADLILIRPGAADTIVGSTVAPSTTGEWDGVIRWNTEARVNGAPAFPSGPYKLAVRMSTSAAPIVTGDSVPVFVRNP